MSLPEYIQVPVAQGLKWVQVLATYTHPHDLTTHHFAVYRAGDKRDRLMVVEMRTGEAVGNLKGAWGTDRRFVDRYTRSDLERLCREHVVEAVKPELLYKIQGLTSCNRLSS